MKIFAKSLYFIYILHLNIKRWKKIPVCLFAWKLSEQQCTRYVTAGVDDAKRVILQNIKYTCLQKGRTNSGTKIKKMNDKKQKSVNSLFSATDRQAK